MLRMLGVEEQVKSFSTFKPGATVNVGPKVNFSFPFDELRMTLPKYAYNVLRDKFDEALLENAKKAGAKVIEVVAKVERVEGTDWVRLSDETLRVVGDVFSGPPDFIVDAMRRVCV